MTGINNFNIYGGNEAAEADYQSPNKISPEALARIRHRLGAAATGNLK